MVREIAPVGALDVPRDVPRDVPGVDSTSQTRPSKHIKHIKSALDCSATTLKVVASVGALFKDLAQGVELGFKCAKIPNVLLFPYNIRDLIVNVKKIVSRSGVFYDKVKAGLESIINLDESVAAVAAAFKIFITAKIISNTVGCWIPYFNMVDVFVDPVDIGLKGGSVFNLYKLRRDLNSLIGAAEASSSSDKALKWDAVLARVQEEDGEGFRTKLLSISKKADVVSRVATLRAALQAVGDTTKAVQDSSKLMEMLAPRVTKQYGFELAELVNKVIACVGDVFVVFTPFFMVGAAILVSTAAISLVLMAGRAMLIHKNPFDEYSRSRAEALPDFLIPSRKEVLSLRKQMQELSAKKEENLHQIQEQEDQIRIRNLQEQEAEMRNLEEQKSKQKEKVRVQGPSIAERIKTGPRVRRQVKRFEPVW